jgi:hypothetical protein
MRDALACRVQLSLESRPSLACLFLSRLALALLCLACHLSLALACLVRASPVSCLSRLSLTCLAGLLVVSLPVLPLSCVSLPPTPPPRLSLASSLASVASLDCLASCSYLLPLRLSPLSDSLASCRLSCWSLDCLFPPVACRVSCLSPACPPSVASRVSRERARDRGQETGRPARGRGDGQAIRNTG